MDKSAELLRTHSYQCNQCDKAFSLKGALTKHLRTQTGEKTYQSTECNKAFTERGKHDCHLRIHVGEKP